MLLIFGKIFERNIFDNVYGYEYNLLNPNQRQSQKMVKHTLTISRQFADELILINQGLDHKIHVFIN